MEFFAVYPLAFRLRAMDSIHFPALKPGNILRGALGTIFRKIACVPDCPGVKTCELRRGCAYARVFEPGQQKGEGPSGLADWPRPFVFRSAALDGRTVQAGEEFGFLLNVFEKSGESLPYFVRSFAELAREGLGPGRGRAELLSVDLPEECLFDGHSVNARVDPLRIPLGGEGNAISHLRIRFVTPAEFKARGELSPQPEFGVLFGRARDRVSTLRALYGDGPLVLDFRAMGERARQIRITRCDLREVSVERRSSRTAQVHPLGGMLGEVEYEGDLAEFVPLLRAAEYTGVGRQTVWGKGEIRLECLTGS